MHNLPTEAINTTVRFIADSGEMSVAKVKQPGAGQDTLSGRFVDAQIAVYNARKLEPAASLDDHGFCGMVHETAVHDFYDDSEVTAVYYPETAELVRQATGAAKVVVFDHTIRVDDVDKRHARKVRAPVSGMHNDFTERSAPQRVKDLLGEAEADARLQRRYGSINVWRPIVGPVETKPLAICAWPSINPNDLVAAERHYPDGRIGGIYYLRPNPQQRWYAYPEMQRDEVILLKCFDSLTDGTARWTAHGAFNDPTMPANPVPRESIEMRTLYFYD